MIELGQGIDVGPGISIGYFNVPSFVVNIVEENNDPIITEAGDPIIEET